METVEASLETTASPETSGEPASIVLRPPSSAEEIAEKEHDEAVQKVLDGYANLGIAGVSGYLNVRKIPETYGEVVGKLLSGGACEIIDTSAPTAGIKYPPAASPATSAPSISIRATRPGRWRRKTSSSGQWSAQIS